MTTLIFRPTAAFRSWRRATTLLLLGASVACQSGGAAATDTAQAALDSTDSTTANPSDAPAAQGTATFSIDGQPEPGVSCVLVKKKATGGFQLSFSSEQLLEVTVTQADESPLIVGKFAIPDWLTPGVQATATLPLRFYEKGAEERPPYLSFMGVEGESPTNYLNVYDWGAGTQRLTGREVGQVVFTRIANGTADGSFQSAVYSKPFGTKLVQYQGKDRILHQVKEHLLKGTFKDVPVFDMQKALRGEQ